LKQSPLDPLPTWKENSTIFAEALTHVINASMTEGEVPPMLKEAVITPVLKKPTADKEELCNYRPVSNIHIIGKILEKVVAAQLRRHIQENSLLEP
jgi:hypothetical protein